MNHLRYHVTLGIPPDMRILLPWEKLQEGDYSGWSEGQCNTINSRLFGVRVQKYLKTSSYPGPEHVGYGLGAMIVCFLRAV